MAGNEHDGHRARMRARFAQAGLEGFAPHEALELLLFYAIPRRNVNPLAHHLIDRFGSLGAVLDAQPEQLCQVEGISEASATLISLVAALARASEKERQAQRAVITNYRDAKDYCAHLFMGKTDEVLYAICLDAQGRVLRAVPAITGTIDEIAIYPRTIVRTALWHEAHAVVLAHNHPSGVLEPSDADIETTALLREALGMVDIGLLDHIIYADGECMSMAQWQQARQPQPLHDRKPRAADTQRRAAARPKAKKERDDGKGD